MMKVIARAHPPAARYSNCIIPHTIYIYSITIAVSIHAPVLSISYALFDYCSLIKRRSKLALLNSDEDRDHERNSDSSQSARKVYIRIYTVLAFVVIPTACWCPVPQSLSNLHWWFGSWKHWRIYCMHMLQLALCGGGLYNNIYIERELC